MHQLGERATPVQVSAAVRQLCAWRPLSVAELAEILGRGKKHLLRNHLTPMIREDALAYTLPEQPNHPQQKYRAAERTEAMA
jgi:ATP-dependent DNA helicase RecG